MKGKVTEINQAKETTLMNDLIVDAIQDIKGKKIIKIDLSEIEDSPAQFFIICEGTSTTQVGAIASNIKKRVKEELSIRCSHLEGMRESTWVLLDYFDIVIHVFLPEMREFYDLEGLWGDGIFTEYQEL